MGFQLLHGFRLYLRAYGRSWFLWAGMGLAALPVLLIVLLLVFGREHYNRNPTWSTYQDLNDMMLRFVFEHFLIFIMASGLGFSLLRQEFEGRTLHYFLLQPVPRWLLVLSKVLAYLALTSILCVASLWLTYLLVIGGIGAGKGALTYLAEGMLWRRLLRDSGVLVLGLLAYGSIALVVGLIFRSGFYAVVLFGWELALPYVPTTFKRLTIIFYLQSLTPIANPLPVRPWATPIAPPPSTLVSLVALLGLSLGLILAAGVLFQRKECLYSGV